MEEKKDYGEISTENLGKLNLENLKNNRNLIENSFSGIGKEKLESLKKSISQIKELINQREELSKEVIDESEEIKHEISNFINNIPADIGDPHERIALKNKKIELSELQLKEKINCWKDVALLKKELRDFECELSEREEREKMMGELLK